MSDTDLMTADELASLPDDGQQYELSKGRLISMCPTGSVSSVVAANVLIDLGGFVKRGRHGVCGTAEGGFRLTTAPDTVRAPDVWFVRAERIPAEGIPATFWPGAPDLAVEVLSPSDRLGDLMLKLRDYFEAGVTLVWAIDPATRSAGVFRRDRAERFIGEDGVLDGEDVLPGFTLRLADVLL